MARLDDEHERRPPPHPGPILRRQKGRHRPDRTIEQSVRSRRRLPESHLQLQRDAQSVAGASARLQHRQPGGPAASRSRRDVLHPARLAVQPGEPEARRDDRGPGRGRRLRSRRAAQAVQVAEMAGSPAERRGEEGGGGEEGGSPAADGRYGSERQQGKEGRNYLRVSVWSSGSSFLFLSWIYGRSSCRLRMRRVLKMNACHLLLYNGIRF
mmetsp:Transcript_29029/g.66470  ORF Transcript_29029/g.66470 Transcript_29029/m.66470 type:complete len:211 (-) Transcript_29029:144-776(-)